MNARKQYFVTVDTEDIREMSIPDSGIEYEIYADADEIKEVEMLFMEKRKKGKQAVEYIGKPFDEWGADDKRNKYDEYLVRIYQKVYDLGTSTTKEKIAEIGLLN
ncbi:hypothetical protein CFK40_12310 [Virgibacillus necropolis]|uniref:Uncharacterized protein n=2 Tax=Virgibacillus necropolis TaxID=163877 RepID=A0A221MDJ5_9BACI|nr:hypothetical protein CFK40_12310 [Virgibacillus necropolis]